MSIKRPLVVGYEERGYEVAIRVLGPDLVVEIDGVETGPFYLNVAAAREGATRTIDQKIKEKKGA